MGILKPAVNGTAHIKMGLLGFESSGKTRTSVEMAVGWTKYTKGSKVAFFDTEKGSDFHIKRFKAENIEFMVVKSRSFKDLCDTIIEAEKEGYSFLIIDSITHVWRDLTTAYLKKKNKTRLSMPDWGILKGEWAKFTDLYVNSKLSISMNGRAGHEYDIDEDDEGNQEMKKSGTKMKVEGETGFEPDLLIQMERAPILVKENTKRGTTKTKRKPGFVNRATVLKDRSDTMNGKTIDFPEFKHFKSYIDFLNVGGEHVGIVQNDNTENALKNEDWSWADKKKRREIALEQLQEALLLGGLDGRSTDVQKRRTELLIKHFGSSSKTLIEGLEPQDIEDKLRSVKIELNQIDASTEPPELGQEAVNF